MKRPRYESEEDLSREREVGDALGRYTGLEAVKFVNSDGTDPPVDYGLYEADAGQPSYMVEVKCRTNKRLAYPDYMISRSKLNAIREAADQRGSIPMLAVRWTDCIGWTRIRLPDLYKTAPGGRKDRGDPKDEEIVCHIPLEDFEIVD